MCIAIYVWVRVKLNLTGLKLDLSDCVDCNLK